MTVFRIRQLADDTLPGDRRDLARVQEILKDRLPGIPVAEIDSLPDRLRDPLRYQLRAILLVADDLRSRLKGFALLSFAPDVGFCLLDYVASGESGGGGGVGGALYERVRTTARELGAVGLFFECLPDEPEACSDPAHAAQNSARLRFYERYGARPIVGTGYETPLNPGDKDMPHLVFDDVDSGVPLPAAKLRDVVRAILERKYSDICPPGYIETVLASIVDDPVRLREPRYAKRPRPKPAATGEELVALVVNRKHNIHHVRERGYVESPVRVSSILAGIEPSGLFWERPAREFPETHIRAVHDPELVSFVKRVCAQVPVGKSIYPYVFPLRNHARLPKDLTYAAGYYCIDTFTPLNRNAYLAAKRGVDCALTAADFMLAGQRCCYALVRPPGHHAERSVFGGFCYFNNAAIAAHYLTQVGPVAILDIDYHHGNGQQDIFYRRRDVLTISIHGNPSFAYPFFSGFAEETGEGEGEGCNLNLPLPEKIDAGRYQRTLGKAIERIREFKPRFLVVALGLDTAKQDPTGTWPLRPPDFEVNGRLIGELGLPTLVMQEGGYRTTSLGACARQFFEGLVGAQR